MLLWFEIKKYLLGYRGIVWGILSAVLTCGLLLLAVQELSRRQRLFEPFSIGIVDYDASPETRFVFDFFNDVISMDYLSPSEADSQWRNGEIPAYVELPEQFAADVFSGKNTPFRLYGNRQYPLQLALTKLLASGGIAYLSASQAGIYATFDYAATQGISREIINQKVFLPVNVAFVKRLLEYESLFSSQVLQATGELTPSAHYVRCFICFLCLLNLLSFSEVLRGYTRAVYARFKLAGQTIFRVQLVRLAGLCLVNLLWITPLYAAAVHMTGGVFQSALGSGAALALAVSAFGLMAAALFKNRTAYGLFLLLSALAMLFLAGGIVPLAYLPRVLHELRYVTLPYWASLDTAIGAGALIGFAVLFFGVVCVAESLYFRMEGGGLLRGWMAKTSGIVGKSKYETAPNGVADKSQYGIASDGLADGAPYAHNIPNALSLPFGVIGHARFAWQAFQVRFKSAVTPSFLVAFIWLLLATPTLGLILNTDGGLRIRAGVLDTGLPDGFMERLRFYGQNDCDFIRYTDEEQMKQQVAAHKLECAYVYRDERFIAYRSSVTVTEKILDLLVAATYLESEAGVIGAEALMQTGEIVSEVHGNTVMETIASDIQQRTEAYLHEGSLMEMVLTETGKGATNNTSTYSRLFHGLSGLLAWLLAMLAAMSLAQDTEKSVAQRIKSTGRNGGAYAIAGCLVIFAVTGAFLCLTALLGGLYYPGAIKSLAQTALFGLNTAESSVWAGWRTEGIMGLSYALALTGVSALMAACFRAGTFPAVISFILIFAALLGGTVFDIREVLTSVSFLRYFCLNYYYLKGIEQVALPWAQAGLLSLIGLGAGISSIPLSSR